MWEEPKATKIDTAVAWAVGIANDNSHGYDQGNRWGPDYDCSSLVIQAYENAGIPVKSKYGASTTRDMCAAFLKAGFADVTGQVNLRTGSGLKKGDVIWKVGHVEMMISATQRVGAHSNENGGTTGGRTGDQTGREIDIRSYSGTWTRCLRAPGGSSEGMPPISEDDIINSNEYLTLDQMYNNAIYIASYFYRHGWSLEAISAMLGNMQTESNMNPGLWEGRDEGNTSKGFGLVQWTPATKLIEWAQGQGMNYKDIDTQLARISYELANNIQYIPTTEYPETFAEFAVSEKTPEYLAYVFLNNYERPANRDQPNRKTQARYWYMILSSIDPDWLLGLGGKRGLSLVLMWAATRRKNNVV